MTDERIPSFEEQVSRRRFLQVSATTLGAVGLAACGGSSGSSSSSSAVSSTVASARRRGGTLKIGISDYFSKDGLDPAQQSTTFGLLSGGLLHDTLVRLDESWNVTPMLAAEWSVNPSATQFTYKLRPDVVFPTSGKTLDATDVAWSINHVLQNKTASPGQSLFQPYLDAKGIVVVDPHTIKFNLLKPNVFFPILLGGWYGRVSQANWDFSHGSGGTGPFKSVTFQGGQGFQLVRNPHYWMSGIPYLDGVNGLVISEPATKAQSVLNGDVDMVDQPDFATIPLFQQSSAVTALTGPYGYQMDFGIGGNVKPYSDPRVRKALKMMIDRQKMVEVVCHGQGLVCGDIPVNSQDPFYPGGLTSEPYDPQQAKSLLAQAGYSNGFTANVWTSPTFIGLNDSSVIFKQFAAAVGINASVVSLSTDAWNTHFLQTGVLANYWVRQHPSTMLAFMAGTGGAWNEAKLSDPKLDKLIAQAATEPTFALQKEIYGEALRRYQTLSTTIWPITYKSFWPHKKRVSGAAFHPTDLVDFRQASLS